MGPHTFYFPNFSINLTDLTRNFMYICDGYVFIRRIDSNACFMEDVFEVTCVYIKAPSLKEQ